jgi:hypothetical protein
MIAVKRGQVYKVRRGTYIKVLGVRRGPQPKVRYIRVTRSGRRRAGETEALRWLQYGGKAWRLPESWVAV